MTELIGSISRVVSILIAFVGVIGTLYFVYGAFLMMMSGGNAQRAETGKQAMVQAIVGIVLCLVAFTVINTVTSLVGDSGGAVQVQQMAGTDSQALEQPRVASVSVVHKKSATASPVCVTGATTVTAGTHACIGVTVVFTEPVTVTGDIKLSVRQKGVISLDPTTQTYPASTITFQHTANVGATAEHPWKGGAIQGFILSRGTTIKDADGNNALYAFQEMTIPAGS